MLHTSSRAVRCSTQLSRLESGTPDRPQSGASERYMESVARVPLDPDKPGSTNGECKKERSTGSVRVQGRVHVWSLALLLLLRTVACQDAGSCPSVLENSSTDDFASLVACQFERNGELAISIPSIVVEKRILISGERSVNISSNLESEELVELQCTKGKRILEIRSGATVRLSNLRITGCDLSNALGAIHIRNGSLTLDNVHFEENVNEKGPGALSILDSEVTLQGCEFRGNEGVQGGSISAKGASKLSVKDSIFLSNSAKEQGGALHARSDSEPLAVTVEDTMFQSNMAVDGEGGAIYVTGKDVTLSVSDNTLFLSNKAKLEGGAIFMLNGSNVDMEDASFMSNSAGGGGGAFYAEVGDVRVEEKQRKEKKAGIISIRVTRCTFIGNVHKRKSDILIGGGGAILFRGYQIRFILSQSKFKANRSKFDGGAIYGLRFKSLDLTDVEFDDNHAEQEGSHVGAGGALALLSSFQEQQSKTTISNTRFTDNTSTAIRGGGAMYAGGIGNFIFLGEGVVFKRNRALHMNAGGGGVRLNDGVRLQAEFSPKFVENYATCGGGLMGEKDIVYNMNGAEFKRNTAIEGGAVCNRGNIEAIFNATIFQGNSAENEGGAFWMRNEDPFGGQTSEAEIKESIFRSNSAGSIKNGTGSGGAIFVQGRGLKKMTFVDNEYSKNVASFGGAFAVQGGENVAINQQKARRDDQRPKREFADNKAILGGGIYAVLEADVGTLPDGLPNTRASLFVLSGNISNNTARMGGAMYIKSLSPVSAEFRPRRISMPTVVMFEANILDNFAREGGGGVYLSGVRMKYLQGEISRNIVYNGRKTLGSDTSGGGGVLLRDGALLDGMNATFNKNNAKRGAGGGILAFDSDIDLLRTGVTGCSAAKGGGLYVKFSAGGPKTIVNITNDEYSQFFGNTADLGGGINVEDESSRDSVTMQTPRVLINNATIANNTAAVAGGGIFTDHPSVIHWTCLSAFAKQTDEEDKKGLQSLDPICRKDIIENNHLGTDDNSFGSGMATGPTKRVFTCKENPNATCKEASVPTDGVPPSSREEKLGTAGMKTMDSTKESSACSGIFNHTSGTALKHVQITFFDDFCNVVRGFQITATATVDGDSVTLSGQTESISKAKKAGVLFDGLIVTGPPGTPNITLSFDFLIASNDNFDTVVEGVETGLSLRQCGIGEKLKGNLCEQCGAREFSFARNGTENCTSCPDHATCSAGALIPNNGYWQSSSQSPQVHRCLNVNGCLKDNFNDLLERVTNATNNGTVVALFGDNYPQCVEGYRGVLCGACDPDYGRSAGSHECRKCTPHSLSVSLSVFLWMWMLIILAVIVHSNTALVSRLEFLSKLDTDRMAQIFGAPSQRTSQPVHQPTAQELEMATMTGEYRVEVEIQDGNNESRELAQIDEVVIANPATEVFKILLNFLQITSIAFLLNVQWNEALRQLLIWQGAAANLSTEYFSFDCALSSKRTVPRSIRRIMYFTFLPFTIGITLCLLTAVYAGLTRKDARWIGRFVYAAAMSTVYVFYTYLTRTLAQMLNCVSADDRNKDGFDEMVSLNSSTYWSEDTDVECWTGHHLTLVALLGIPMLLVVSLGAPVGLLIVLYRNKDRLNNREFLERYGFLYKSYKEAWRYWEVVIMTRKALLAVVVVFSFDLGGNLQGILAVVILKAALAAHLIAMPYSDNLRALNVLEACSLIVSMLMFFAGVIFNDPNTDDGAKIFITVFIFVIVFALLGALMHRVYLGLHIWLKLKLVLWDADPSENFHKNALKAAVLVGGKATNFLVILQQRTERVKMAVRRNTF